MIDFPHNVLPWAIASIVLIIFGTRSLLNYRKVKAPLSKYFGVAAVSASIAFMFWTYPFFIFDPADYRLYFAIAIAIGDAILYFALVQIAVIFWYLNLRDRMNFLLYTIPISLISLAGFIGGAYAGITSNDLPQIVGSSAVYPTSLIGDISQTILLIIGVFVGLSMFLHARSQKTRKSRIGTFAIAAMSLGLSIGGLANIHTNTDAGTNSSPIVLWAYVVWIAIFTVVFFVFRLTKKK